MLQLNAQSRFHDNFTLRLWQLASFVVNLTFCLCILANFTLRYHKLRKTYGKFCRSYYELLSKFGAISIQEHVSKGTTHPTFYGDLVYKLRRVNGEANFISSSSKIVKGLWRRQYDPAIIERTISLVHGPFTALYRSFLKRCTLTNKAIGIIWRAFSNLLSGDRVLISVPSDFWSGLLRSLALSSDCT